MHQNKDQIKQSFMFDKMETLQLNAMLKPILADSSPIAGVPGTPTERTFIAIKPDGVQRGLVSF
jgi:uncharacterized protein (DUF2147 family)